MHPIRNKKQKNACRPPRRRRSGITPPPLPLPVDVMTRCLRYFREEAL
jgi:hypothetical protein